MRHAAYLLAALLMLTALASAQDSVPEPQDYRTDNYRGPVPATLSGARVLSTAQAKAIWVAGAAAFVDVLPRPPKPDNLPAGTVWRDRPRQNIPGSIWLPDTGYGVLAAPTEAYLRQGLAKASGGETTKLLVLYCQASCWMSWNAAKRALSFGYVNIAWYPEGTDGWQAAGMPLQQSQPEPR
jgi:PQQ-dependent catabolism-associated CXXCW motif protein